MSCLWELIKMITFICKRVCTLKSDKYMQVILPFLSSFFSFNSSFFFVVVDLLFCFFKFLFSKSKMGSCGFDNAGVVTLTLPRINPHGNTCALLHFNQTLINYSIKQTFWKLKILRLMQSSNNSNQIRFWGKSNLDLVFRREIFQLPGKSL